MGKGVGERSPFLYLHQHSPSFFLLDWKSFILNALRRVFPFSSCATFIQLEHVGKERKGGKERVLDLV